MIGFIRYYSKILISVKSTVIGDINHNIDWQKVSVDSDAVIHLAARVHVMFDNADDPLTEFRKVNTLGIEHLARFSAAKGVKRFICQLSKG